MGNRAVILPFFCKETDEGIYLKYNGDRGFVEAILNYCKMRNFSGFYNIIEIKHILKNTKILHKCGEAFDLYFENDDNGTYFIYDYDIVGRAYNEYAEKYLINQIRTMCYLDECQPKEERLGSEYIFKNFYRITGKHPVVDEEVYNSFGEIVFEWLKEEVAA